MWKQHMAKLDSKKEIASKQIGNYRRQRVLWNYDVVLADNFVIMAFPCNQFGNQEPGPNDQIKELVLVKFKAEFPLFDKV